jgi:predicted HAD superfamily phosphohydrolase YqeG
MVGDRLLTDVLFANLNNMMAVYVTDVITEEGDNWMAKQVKSIQDMRTKNIDTYIDINLDMNRHIKTYIY